MKEWIKNIDEASFDEGKVSQLANRPNAASAYGVGGLSATRLKEWFDKTSVVLQDKLKELITKINDPALVSELPFTFEGSDEEGVTLGTYIKSLYEMIQDVTSEVDDMQDNPTVPSYIGYEDSPVSGFDLPYGCSLVWGEIAIKNDKPLVKGVDRNLMCNIVLKRAYDLGETGETRFVVLNDGGVVFGFYSADGSYDLKDVPFGALQAAVEFSQRHSLEAEQDTSPIYDTGGVLKTNYIDPQGDEFKGEAVPDSYLEKVKNDILEAVGDNVGCEVRFDINPETYVLKVSLLDKEGAVISSSEVDLPLESMIINAETSEDGKKLILTFNNAEKTQVEYNIESLLSGLVSTDALTLELEKKLDKLENKSGMHVYTYESGVQRSRELETNPSAGSVPIYGANGVLKAGTPASDADCTNKKYVDDRLKGKVDIPDPETEEEKAMRRIPFYQASEEKTGHIGAVYEPTANCIPIYSEERTIKTGLPEDDADCANKQFVEEKLSPILPANVSQYSIYGTGGKDEITGKISPLMYKTLPCGTGAGVVSWYAADHNIFDTANPTRTIGVADPRKPIQAANMRYVNAEDAKLAERLSVLEDAVMGLYQTITLSGYDYVELPDSYLPNMYVEIAQQEFVEVDPETWEYIDNFFVDAHAVNYMDINNSPIGTEEITAPCYIRVPKGTKLIYPVFEPPAAANDYVAGTNFAVTLQTLNAGG